MEAPPRRFTVTTLAIAVAMVLVACGDDKAPDTVAPPGFVVVPDAKAGLAIAVPADWERIPLPEGDLDRFDRNAADLTNRNPSLLPAINQARQLLQFGGRVMAVSQDGLSVINVNVDKADEKNLDEVLKNTTAGLTQAGASSFSNERTTVAGQEALKLNFRLPIDGPRGTTIDAQETQYFVLKGGKSFVVTFQNPPQGVADTVIATFRLR